MKLLLIEDSPEIVKGIFLTFKLRWPDAVISCAENGRDGLKKLKTESIDIVILDINLPDISGFEILENIRTFSEVPIILLSLRDDEADRLHGLETGADDYIVKPFSPDEFLSRCKAVLRRSGTRLTEDSQLTLFESGNSNLNLNANQFLADNKKVYLTPIEKRNLYSPAHHEGKVVSRGVNMTKVLLMDDDHLFLQCLEYTLSKDYTDFRIVGKITANADIVRRVDELKPDVVVIGIRPEYDHAIEAIETLCEKYPSVKVIVLSVSEDGRNLSRMVQAGISAYLLRTCSIQELAESILAVASGTYLLTPSMAGKLMEALRQQSRNAKNQSIFSLSDREKEILQYAAMGASNKEIAGRCYISETTVKSHFRNILSKMDVRNRAGAVALATSSGILPKLKLAEKEMSVSLRA